MENNLQDFLTKIPDGIKIIDANNMIISPGLIDQHIHGGYDCDFNLSTEEEMVDFSTKLAAHGVTAILPTIMTAPEQVIKKQIETVKKAKSRLPGTKFLGIHIEGPFLSLEYKGIHPEISIISPQVENFKKIEDAEIKVVTFSPDIDKDFKLTEYLSDKNIIPSAGHTGASAESIYFAQKHGLKQITHLFNAMAPLHHRNPGITGEALVNDSLYTEVIADGMHLDPIIIELILRAKP